MTNLDFTQIRIDQLITHHVGNKLRDEKFTLSSELTTVEEDTEDLLLKYFLLTRQTNEYYSFSHQIKLDLNEIFVTVSKIFSNPKSFITASQDIAKLLYEQSMHPQIKEGELNIVRFSNIVLGAEKVNAIGIFKSETNVPFLKMINGKSKFNIGHDFGFDLKGMDKGCIIFNTERNTGYKVLIIDNTNKSSEAQYWKDSFLQVKPLNDDFHQTNQFLTITKNYVTKQLSEEYDINKADKIDLLNRSMDYFKTHENFDKKEFEKEVFQDSGIIKSFRKFDESFRTNNDIDLDDQFEISNQAVKKQSKIFKTVLKLDKNFHIYIHGNRELIEQGVDKDGRKFYKIYYQQES